MWRRRIAPVLVAAALVALGGCQFETRVATPEAGTSRPAARTPAKETTVPLRIINAQNATVVLVPVKVNGRGPYEFILDTGAASSSVDRRLVRRLHLPETGETARVRGVGGSTLAPLVRLRDWTVGGQRLRARSLVVTDVGDDRVAGLLGSDELRRFGVVTVDFRRERLILRGT
jgi:predicted aspartyl protease